MDTSTSENVGKRFKNIKDLKLYMPTITLDIVELKTTSPHLYYDVRDREVFSRDTGASFSPIENVNAAFVCNDEEGRSTKTCTATIPTVTGDNDLSHCSDFDSKLDELEIQSKNLKGLKNLDPQEIIGETKSPYRKGLQQTQAKCFSIRKVFVLLGAFFIFLLSSFPFNISVIYVDLRERYDSSNAETSLVQVVTIGITLGLGIISGLMVDGFGIRNTGIISGILVSSGLSLNYVAMTISFIVVTLGITSGIGFSILLICAFASIGKEDFGVANPFAVSFISFGGGVGSMVMPYITGYLIDEYNVQGMFLILGAASLNIVPAILLCAPKEHNNRTNVKISGWKKNICFKLTFPQDIIQRFKQVITNKLFIFFVISISLAICSLLSLLIFFVDILRFKGISSSDVRFLFLIYGIMSTVGRIIPGLIKFIPHVSVLSVSAIITGLGCLSVALITYASTYGQIVGIVCAYGMAIGSSLSHLFIATLNLVGSENYNAANGVLMSVTSIGIMVGGPISGAIRDISGNYDALCLTVSIASGLAFVMFIIAAFWRQRISVSNVQIEMSTHL